LAPVKGFHLSRIDLLLLKLLINPRDLAIGQEMPSTNLVWEADWFGAS